MRNLLLPLTMMAMISQIVRAQVPIATDSIQVEFNKSDHSVARYRTGVRVLQFAVEADNLVKDTVYTISITEDNKTTTLSGADYSFEVPYSTIKGKDEKQSLNFFVTIEPDTLPDRDRKLVLTLDVKAGTKKTAPPNKGKRLTLTITVKQAAPAIDGYNYLAFVGTNFDLVDGIQANKLFFATNIYLPPSSSRKSAFYLSLYGNRAFTTIDSANRVPWRTGLERTSDSTFTGYFATTDRITTFKVDNLGASFTPFFRLGKFSDAASDVRYFFAPTAEFIWRRVSRTTTYSDPVATDTVVYSGSLAASFTSPDQFTAKENRFEVLIGPGLFIAHDTEKISIHVHTCIGLSDLIIPQGLPTGTMGEVAYGKRLDAFFMGRAWITEPYSGLTLQAEVMNTLQNSRPYYVVTLSKALNFKSLGSVFNPIVSR